MSRAMICFTVAAVLSGCGSAGTAPRRGSSDVLTRDEIVASSAATAYDAVRQLRPNFMRSRGQSSIQSPGAAMPVVYVDNIARGGLDALRDIRAGDVAEIRYVSASDATTRYGTGHSGGVIEVELRAGR